MILGDEAIECNDTYIENNSEFLSDLHKTLIDSNLVLAVPNKNQAKESVSTES